MLEIAGLKASGGVQDGQSKLQLIKQMMAGNMPKETEMDGYTDLGEVVGSRYFRPTITDMKLLKDTKQWHSVQLNENIDEHTFDPE